jgi:ketosteroid isomerase-like protein
MISGMNDKREVMDIHQRWIDLEVSGQGAEVLDLCARDVTWLVPGMGMLKGIDKVREFINNQPEVRINHIDTSDIEVELSGSLAVKKANFCTSLTVGSSDSNIKGSHIWTLRKDHHSNRWQVSSVAWVIENNPSQSAEGNS